MAAIAVHTVTAMKYQFKYENKAGDLWQLSMYGIYRSMVGLINVIFTIAMILLAVRYWSDVNWIYRSLIVLGLSLFTVIQPIVIYGRAKKQLSGTPKDMEIGFDDYGVHVRTENEQSTIKWKKIKGIAKQPTMLIVYSSATRGFILTNQVLGKEREAFYRYVVSKLKR